MYAPNICKKDYIVTKANLRIKRIAIRVTIISFFVYLPVRSLMRTYAIAPIPIPFAIEYVSGIIMRVKNAGTALEISSISTAEKFFNINTPTKIRAGAVAAEGMIEAIGLKNNAIKKQAEVITLVNPVLPPAATPDADSTNVVHVEVPRTAPAQVPIESQSIALSTSIGSPFSSSISA